ncbi:MAG: GNAT family N-acetyltransferase [Chloroflexi bacterium]|nr:GNAT family N-acetyltransferase [Chloroflexota bacterium]
MLGPTLTGQMVTLAPLKPEHLQHYVEWFADPEVTRYLTRDVVVTLKQEEEWLDHISRSQSDVQWGSSLRDSTLEARGLRRLTGVADMLSRGR